MDARKGRVLRSAEALRASVVWFLLLQTLPSPAIAPRRLSNALDSIRVKVVIVGTDDLDLQRLLAQKAHGRRRSPDSHP